MRRGKGAPNEKEFKAIMKSKNIKIMEVSALATSKPSKLPEKLPELT